MTGRSERSADADQFAASAIPRGHDRTMALPAVLTVSLCLVASLAAEAKVLKAEPPAGSVRAGQHVLVDDGSCPPGQVKEITGGNNNLNIQAWKRRSQALLLAR